MLLNSTLLPFQGIGKNNFFLNEHMTNGVSLLDFPILGDYAQDDHHFQQHARKQEDPTYEIQAYRGDLFPTWARLTIDGAFSYATIFSLAARLRDVIDETGTKHINELIPHDYIEGKNHGKQECQGTIFDFQVDAAGREPQLDELQHRFYKYMHTRYEHLLKRFDKESKRCVYIQHIELEQEPHINFVFYDKSAFDAVRFRYFYKDCEHISGDIVELDALAKQEQKETVKFLDKNYRDIISSYDPSVIRNAD